MSKLTFREIMTRLDGAPIDAAVPPTPREEAQGLKPRRKISAVCWTDDESALDDEAFFDVRPDWANEMSFVDASDCAVALALRELCEEVARKVGGRWGCRLAGRTIEQV